MTNIDYLNYRLEALTKHFNGEYTTDEYKVTLRGEIDYILTQILEEEFLHDNP